MRVTIVLFSKTEKVASIAVLPENGASHTTIMHQGMGPPQLLNMDWKKLFFP